MAEKKVKGYTRKDGTKVKGYTRKTTASSRKPRRKAKAASTKRRKTKVSPYRLAAQREGMRQMRSAERAEKAAKKRMAKKRRR